ncbi:MAG: hypothetical protein U0T36_02610 [Saprospiraceae bacterium]
MSAKIQNDICFQTNIRPKVTNIRLDYPKSVPVVLGGTFTYVFVALAVAFYHEESAT